MLPRSVGHRRKTGWAHKLQHASDKDKGIIDRTVTNGVRNSERKAVKTENKVRNQTGDKQRTEYGGVKL